MQSIFRLIAAAFVAIVIVLSFGNFNTAQAQWEYARFEDTQPDTAYVLPDEVFHHYQPCIVSDFMSNGIVTFELNVYKGDLVDNEQPFSFAGCDTSYLNQCGSIIFDDRPREYHANWVADNQGLGVFTSFIIQFNNELPVGSQTGYIAGVNGYVLDYNNDFQLFYDYLSQTVISIDGVKGDANGDGEVTSADVEIIQEYCFAWWNHQDWRYQNDGINVGRSLMLFSYPTLLDAYLINLWLINPNDPLVVNLGIGELISSTAYGNSSVQPAPHTISQVWNELTISTDGLAAFVFGNLPDGTHWQAASWTSNSSATFQLPADLQNMRVEAVSLEGATDINMPVTMPQTCELQQNYPNPFNPSTTIDFSLQSASQTSLKVYNLNGDLVTTLADGTMSAGQHSIAFDGSAMASGTYIYELKTNNKIEAKKMILMK